MKNLLKLKELIKSFYEKYDKYVLGFIRFAAALIVYLTLFYHTGYNAAFSNPLVAVGLAAISAFLPSYMITVFGTLILIIQFLSVAIEIAVIALIIFVLMLLLYFVFKADKSWILMFTAVICLSGLTPAVLPVALLVSPVETIVVAFGALTYGLVAVVRKDVSVLTSGSNLSLGGRVNLLLTDLLSNEYFILLIVTLSASVLLISAVRRSKINHASLVAIVFGNLLFLISFLLGNYFLDISLDVAGFIVGFAINILFTFLLLTLVLSMDYKRTEEVQFEDDDYYYFVKAIPKVAISLTKKRMENITSGSKEKDASGDIDVKQVFVRKDDES